MTLRPLWLASRIVRSSLVIVEERGLCLEVNPIVKILFSGVGGVAVIEAAAVTESDETFHLEASPLAYRLLLLGKLRSLLLPLLPPSLRAELRAPFADPRVLHPVVKHQIRFVAPQKLVDIGKGNAVAKPPH